MYEDGEEALSKTYPNRRGTERIDCGRTVVCRRGRRPLVHKRLLQLPQPVVVKAIEDGGGHLGVAEDLGQSAKARSCKSTSG